MADPVITDRTTPTGAMLEDGHASFYAFEEDPDIDLWEVEVTPPGKEGGDKIDVTTMHNTARRTYAPRTLVEGTDGSFTCGYDPACSSQIDAIINKPMSITCHYPNGDAEAFFGYLKTFQPQGMSIGGFPTANVTIVQTNRDPVSKAEAGTTYRAASGTA